MNDRPRRTLVVLAAVTVTALALAGAVYFLFGRGLDDAGVRACAEFASSRYTEATGTSARVAIAEKINNTAAKSDSGRIAETARRLGPGATGSDQDWQAAYRAMDKACSDAGWVPDY